MTNGGEKKRARAADAAGSTSAAADGDARSSARRFDRVRDLPPWISAFAASMGVLLTALVALGLINNRPAASIPPATAAAADAQAPVVTLESVVVDPQTVEGLGSFARVDPALSEIVFIGRPADAPNDAWLATPANMAPVPSGGGAIDGRWSAKRPSPAERYQWYAILWPAASGASGADDLAKNGPDSEFVQAHSEPWLAP